jgi:hypothetical protein
MDLYNHLKIPYLITNEGEYTIMIIGNDPWNYPDTPKSPLIDGYNGFYTKIQFNQTGKFISQGFWE